MGKKEEQLGMATGTAANRLRKLIIFDAIQQLGKDECYRCGNYIYDIDDFSVEHKEPWLDSGNALELYFDLNNIAFSHLSCNSGAHRSGREPARHGTITSYMEYGCRCDDCKEAKTIYRKRRYDKGAGRSA